MKFLTPLLQFSPKNIEAQILGFEVFLRRQKYLLAIKCLIAATAIDRENATVQEQKIRFKKVVDGELEGVEPKVVEIIKEEYAKLFLYIVQDFIFDNIAWRIQGIAWHSMAWHCWA
ncbi:hypothetical protein EYC84_010400 [Monilinia fructicola]|uniref:PCI domain-containing protein n=1 Tax=Monilinia fructicola TaxID=38448 RepID=A0A5M9JHF0_MONFR|nr:hypothetical protein EYC84_010400 [Monilinia fructicola]